MYPQLQNLVLTTVDKSHNWTMNDNMSQRHSSNNSYSGHTNSNVTNDTTSVPNSVLLQRYLAADYYGKQQLMQQYGWTQSQVNAALNNMGLQNLVMTTDIQRSFSESSDNHSSHSSSNSQSGSNNSNSTSTTTVT